MATQTKKTRRFKLLRGGHVHQEWRDATAEEIADENIKKSTRNGKPVILIRHQYSQGTASKPTIIESDVDLVQRFGSAKFAYADDNPQPQVESNPWQDLEKKTEKQLRALAEYEEIDVSKAKTKQEIIDLLRSAVSGD
jgi:hypothetical protein